MTILYLADIRFPLERANGIQTMETCYALAARGHQVALAVRHDRETPPRDPFAFYGLAPHPRLEIRRAGRARAGAMGRARYLARAIRAALLTHADAILTRDLGVAAVLVDLPRLLRPPLVYESHGFAPAVADAIPDLLGAGSPPSAAKRERLTAREQDVWQRAEGYVTITRALADELGARFGTRASVAAIPDGVRLEVPRHYVPRPMQRPAVVGYAGHLYPWKGVDVLLNAVARLPDARGLIIGGHPSEPDLARCRALADTLGVADRVTFTGLIAPSDVAARLARADVLVLPNPASPISTSSTSPLKLFEYMAAGRPIVASDLPSIREVIRPDDNGVLVEPGSAAALAAGVRRVVEDPAFADRLARAAFEDVGAYGWDRRAERLECLLESVTGAS